MHPVLIACSSSGDLVPTGLHADDLDGLDPVNRLPICPSCGGAHEWEPAEAVLAQTVA